MRHLLRDDKKFCFKVRFNTAAKNNKRKTTLSSPANEKTQGLMLGRIKLVESESKRLLHKESTIFASISPKFKQRATLYRKPTFSILNGSSPSSKQFKLSLLQMEDASFPSPEPKVEVRFVLG